MNTITINGKPAGITLEAEKTLGELLSGLDSWLEGSGQYLSGIEIDGKTYGSSLLENAFDLGLDGISRLDIKTSSWAELMLEALFGVKNDLEFYEKNPPGSSAGEAAFEGPSAWKEGHAALFLKTNAPDIYQLTLQILDGKILPEKVLPLITERIRELRDPASEIRASLPAITEISKRLEDLPLDVQTGKDARAAETIALFSGVTEKLFRLLHILRRGGIAVESIGGFLDEFGSVVKELHSAYTNKDTVLVGDLAEYELAPRLLEFSSLLGGLAAPAEAS
ncbi:MAG: hypothetical protein LBP29_05490 [Treponema sp.]|jgi:hypothetical protein|nr:hypothetical protein [Treponema sp.]